MEANMYFSLIITFLLFLVIIIAGIQNSMPLDLKFFTWNLQMSITALIFYSSVIGGAIVAILILPKLVKKSLNVRSLKREVHKLKENMTALGKEQADGSQVE
jgi:uncharacterized integral membrane protein